jgi:hypothetical protein
LWARLILAQPCCLGRVWPGTKKERELLGRDRPNPFGAEFGPVSWASPAQPNPPNIILYIIMYLYYLYIFIDIKKIKKNYEKSLKHLLIFLHIFIKIV